jgi:hypothetical protein
MKVTPVYAATEPGTKRRADPITGQCGFITFSATKQFRKANKKILVYFKLKISFY